MVPDMAARTDIAKGNFFQAQVSNLVDRCIIQVRILRSTGTALGYMVCGESQ
jgi:hypothetical protein